MEENKHHLFSYREIREKLIGLLGEPKTREEHEFITKEAEWAWRRMPTYKLPIEYHRNIHNEHCKQKEPRKILDIIREEIKNERNTKTN